MKAKFRRWLETAEKEKIKRCPDCDKRINFKYYSIWWGRYKCKCGWKMDKVSYKAKRRVDKT